MTDPSNPIATYGVSIVGSKKTWGYLEDGELRHEEFRPHSGISFEEVVAHAQIRARLMAEAMITSRKSAVELDDIPVEDNEALQTAVAKIIEDQRLRDHERFGLLVDSTLILITPKDRERMEPLLRTSVPQAVRQLHEDLETEVISRTEKTVEAAAVVDPTSPEAPSDS